jgi:uncharacterized protein YbbC (DUF1343 family)
MRRSFSMILFLLIASICILPLHATAEVEPRVLVGVDRLFTEEFVGLLRGKKVGLITNHTAINRNLCRTRDVLKAQAALYGYSVSALFAPEHGINGSIYQLENVKDEVDTDGTPIFSLHGVTRRPTKEMLKNIDILIYDIQDIGARSYTYITTLFYAMEEAAKHQIPVIVLDRPNPINGVVVDGPMLEESFRSMVGYINVPYCHGMTIGELAKFFNAEYKVGCKLTVVPMQGWKRRMSFADTELVWIPTSPHVPEANTPFYYPTTGLIGELQLVSIGIGYTLPFKLIGAPWIDANKFAKSLNDQKFPGVQFLPFYFRPFFGRFAREDCQGVQIVITNPLTYKPVSTQYLIIGILKNLYPQQYKNAVAQSLSRKEMFCQVNGTEEIYRIMTGKGPIIWKLNAVHQKEREAFMKLRQKYLIPSYK